MDLRKSCNLINNFLMESENQKILVQPSLTKGQESLVLKSDGVEWELLKIL
jgi:hypothetical protein